MVFVPISPNLGYLIENWSADARVYAAWAGRPPAGDGGFAALGGCLAAGLAAGLATAEEEFEADAGLYQQDAEEHHDQGREL